MWSEFRDRAMAIRDNHASRECSGCESAGRAREHFGAGRTFCRMTVGLGSGVVHVAATGDDVS